MIKTPTPPYSAELSNLIIHLEKLRSTKISNPADDPILPQIKNMLHMIEALSSARIEGNHTTIAGFIDSRERPLAKNDQISEIVNLITALEFIDNHVETSPIDQRFILELHQIAMQGLDNSINSGNFRHQDVSIAMSEHTPPSHFDVLDLMRTLIEYINQDFNESTELISIAVAHHRFVWIHPFLDGNGRTARLLTYAMLRKRGYINPGLSRLVNPTAVFAGNRNQYYSMLMQADNGGDDGLLDWSEYFLRSIKDETARISRLSDREFVNNQLLLPAISMLSSSGLTSKLETSILERAVRRTIIKAGDIADLWSSDVGSGAIANQIKRLRDAGYLMTLKENGREYTLNFTSSKLTRLVLERMDSEGLLPIPID